MYKIKKVDADKLGLHDPMWDKAVVADVCVDNWSGYIKSPKMTAKLLYSDFGLHIKMETDETKIFATKTEQNSAVCLDSCMEFFFRPNADDERYINFEFNPFGTMYMSLRRSRKDFVFPKEDRDFFDVKTEINDKGWMVAFTIPFEFMDRMVGTHTKTFYGNIYKCCDVNRHFATYYPVKTKEPDYHRPEYFDKFVLE